MGKQTKLPKGIIIDYTGNPHEFSRKTEATKYAKKYGKKNCK